MCWVPTPFPHDPAMADRPPTILVLCDDARRQKALEQRCAELGFKPLHAHAYEKGVDALQRVRPRAALVALTHPAAESRRFLARAMELGTRVVLVGGGIDGPDAGGIFAFGGGLRPVVSDPVEDGLAKVLGAATVA